MTTRFDFQSQLGELATLRDHVLAMHETLEGGAHFESMESNVLVERTIDRFGHVFGAMILRISRGAETWAELTFNIQEDQTLLWNVAANTGEKRCESLSRCPFPDCYCLKRPDSDPRMQFLTARWLRCDSRASVLTERASRGYIAD